MRTLPIGILPGHTTSCDTENTTLAGRAFPSRPSPSRGGERTCQSAIAADGCPAAGGPTPPRELSLIVSDHSRCQPSSCRGARFLARSSAGTARTTLHCVELAPTGGGKLKRQTRRRGNVTAGVTGHTASSPTSQSPSWDIQSPAPRKAADVEMLKLCKVPRSS